MKKMIFFMKFIPKSIQKKMLRKMMQKMCSYFRLEKKINSVVIAVGGHPGEFAIMNEDLERIADELSFFSLISNGQVVSTIKAGGVMAKKSDHG